MPKGVRVPGLGLRGTEKQVGGPWSEENQVSLRWTAKFGQVAKRESRS